MRDFLKEIEQRLKSEYITGKAQSTSGQFLEITDVNQACIDISSLLELVKAYEFHLRDNHYETDFFDEIKSQIFGAK